MKKNYGLKTVDVYCGDAKFRFHNMYRTGTVTRDGFFHTHKHYECHFVENGEYLLETESERITVPPGHLIVVPPGTGHFTVLRDDLAKYVMAFSLEKAESENQGFCAIYKSLLESVAMRPLPVSAALIEKAAEVQEMEIPFTAAEYCRCMRIALAGMEQLFSEINEQAAEKLFGKDVAGEGEFSVLLNLYVGDQEYSMEEIAERLGYSPRHLARVIQRKYGMSLAEYRNKQRCEEAKRLLRHTKKPMDAIAAEVGFKSPEAMRQAFKRWEGTTPARYRKNHKKPIKA